MNKQEPSNETEEQWRKDSKNWKVWGLFYYNPEDKRLFPPKRFDQIGFTANFANPKSIFALLIVLLWIIFLIWILPNKG